MTTDYQLQAAAGSGTIDYGYMRIIRAISFEGIANRVRFFERKAACRSTLGGDQAPADVAFPKSARVGGGAYRQRLIVWPQALQVDRAQGSITRLRQVRPSVQDSSEVHPIVALS
jgi:hypothetical protein